MLNASTVVVPHCKKILEASLTGLASYEVPNLDVKSCAYLVTISGTVSGTDFGIRFDNIASHVYGSFITNMYTGSTAASSTMHQGYTYILAGSGHETMSRVEFTLDTFLGECVIATGHAFSQGADTGYTRQFCGYSRPNDNSNFTLSFFTLAGTKFGHGIIRVYELGVRGGRSSYIVLLLFLKKKGGQSKC